MCLHMYLSIIRPHRLHPVHEMRPTATDVERSVVCVSVCVFSCAKTAELIEMPFGGLTHVDPTNHVLDWGPDPPPWEGTLMRGHVLAQECIRRRKE